jgi:hypothetical protein
MAGPVPAISLSEAQRLNNLVGKITPSRVLFHDNSCFPNARPMLDILFSLDGSVRGIEDFEIDELIDPVSRRVSFYESVLVFMDTPHKIARDPDVQRTAWTARKDVQIVLFLHPALPSGMAGTSPAMTAG